MSPRRIHWRGHTYPSIGWALGDVLLAFPLASDQQVAEWLNVTPQTICLWRHKVGIPEFRMRNSKSCYQIQERLGRCEKCQRTIRLKPAQRRRKCPGCGGAIELTTIEVREVKR